MTDLETKIKAQIQSAAGRQQALLAAFSDAVAVGDSAMLAAIERDLKKAQAETQRLSGELRFVQLEANTGVSRTRARATGKSAREIALDVIDEIGVPVAPATISDFSAASTGLTVQATRFASLRRDEQSAAKRDPASRPAWVAPALSTAHLTALPRLFTSSAWPLHQRLVGPRSARVYHLYTTLAFLDRYERLRAAPSADPAAMEVLVVRFARGIPGATATGEDLDSGRIREVIKQELAAIEPADLEERRAAAKRLSKHRDQEKLWGLPALIEGGSKGERAGG